MLTMTESQSKGEKWQRQSSVGIFKKKFSLMPFHCYIFAVESPLQTIDRNILQENRDRVDWRIKKTYKGHRNMRNN